ncbi:MAG: glutamate synthase [Actinomycetota bacterium]|nr:glutamate synthase [Actinomycetota bacterium]
MTTLSVASLGVRKVNEELRRAPAGSTFELVDVIGEHNLAVGLVEGVDVRIEGNVGYYVGGLCGGTDGGPTVTVDGFAGWGVGENLMGGEVRVRGNASESTGSSAHGGFVVVEGDASSRAAISLKGGTVLVAGDVGHASAFMAQAGTLLVGGDAGHDLGDSLYEAVVYVGGQVSSLGADARVEDLTDDDVATVRALVDRGGPAFAHVDPENVTRVASARTLYNFDALKNQKY